MEREVPIDRNDELDQLVSEAERGETVVLTRDGVAVASIVATVPRSDADRSRARAAMESIVQLRKGVTLDGLSIRELIDEGRKQ